MTQGSGLSGTQKKGRAPGLPGPFSLKELQERGSPPRGLALPPTTGHTGAVTLIQRFGSALNLNVHLHMIFVDGVYLTDGAGPPVFRRAPSPRAAELQALVQCQALHRHWRWSAWH